MKKQNDDLKILIIRLGAIGDVVHSTIIPQAIKEKHPECEIHFLTLDYIAPLLKSHKGISKVIPFKSNKGANFFYLLKLGLNLRKEKYGIIMPLSNTTTTVFLQFIINSKKIIKRNKNRIHAVDAFYNTAIDLFEDLEKPKNLDLGVNEKAKNKIVEKIKSYPRPYITISPGGAHDNIRQGRIWVDSYWTEFGNKVLEKFGGTVFIAGSKGEREEHKKFLKIKNSVLFSGELSLDESAALFSLTDLFISGDSGPLHMASALNINTLGIIGSTSPIPCAPYGEKGHYIAPSNDCKHCQQKICIHLKDDEKFTPCMYSITPDMVLDFIEDKKLL